MNALITIISARRIPEGRSVFIVNRELVSLKMVRTGSPIVGLHFRNVGNHPVQNVGLCVFRDVGFHASDRRALLYTDCVRSRSGV
jgi:hypothetical protein